MGTYISGSSNLTKQIDSTPTQNSNNLVSSGGVYTSISNVQRDITSIEGDISTLQSDVSSAQSAASTALSTANSASSTAASASSDVQNLANGTRSGGTFINNTTITAPTINGVTATGTWDFSSATVVNLNITAVFG